MSDIKDNGSFDAAGVDGAGMDFQQDILYGAGAKRCNCKKARCLKLYCVCFSAGVYCSGCACRDCLNTLENQDLVHVERTKKLAASPGAFAPKVELKAEGELACHKKGCRCRRSRCVKKYCECFDAQVFCSTSCRCEACLNLPKGGAPVTTAIPHVQQMPPLARGGSGSADLLMPRLLTVGSGSGSGAGATAAAVAAAVAALQEKAALVAADMSGMDIDLGALDASGLAARGPDGLTALPTRGSLGTHGSFQFGVAAAASGAGSFLMSLQPGPLGLTSLSFLDGHPPPLDSAMGQPGDAAAGTAAAPGENAGTAAEGGRTAAIELKLEGGPGKAAALQDGAAQVPPSAMDAQTQAAKPGGPLAAARRLPASAFMFAEAEAVLAAEEHTAATGAPGPSAAATAIASTTAATAAAREAATADPREERMGVRRAPLEGAGSGGEAAAAAPPPQPQAEPAAGAAGGSGDGGPGGVGRRGEDGQAHGERKEEGSIRRRNSSDPEDAAALPRGGGASLTGPGPPPASMDPLPLMPAGSGTVPHGGVLRPPPSGEEGVLAAVTDQDAGAAPAAAPAAATAAPETNTSAPHAIAADRVGASAECAGATNTGNVGEAASLPPQGAPLLAPPCGGGGGGGGDGAAAAAYELSPMEALLAAPTLLLEEPLRAEELAAQLGLDASQQLAARKAAHILRTLLCMAASAVRLTRSGALGCSRWEQSQSLGRRPLASHSHFAPSVAGGAAQAGAAATSCLRAPAQGKAHEALQRQQQDAVAIPPLGAAAGIPPAAAYNGGVGGGLESAAGRRAQEYRSAPGRIQHLPPLHLPPLSLSCGSQGGAAGALRLGHGSYRFAGAGRLSGPEPSAISGSHVDGDAQPPDAAVAAGGVAAAAAAGADGGDGAATTIMSTVSPGPSSRHRGRELSRRPCAGPEASYAQPAPRGAPPHGRGAGGGAAAAAAHASNLRRGSRVKRPNSLLADMELDDGRDELEDRNVAADRRSHHHNHLQEAHGLVYGRRSHLGQQQQHPHPQQHRYRTVSPAAEPPSPKRSRHAGWRGAAARRARPPTGRSRSRAGSWQDDDEDGEGEEEEEAEASEGGGDDSEAGPMSALRAQAVSPFAVAGLQPSGRPQRGYHHSLVSGLPAAAGRHRNPGRRSSGTAWTAAMAAAAMAVRRTDRGRSGAEEGSGTGEDEEDVDGDEEPEGARGGGGGDMEMSEGDSDNGASEMEAMQALFDLRTAAAAAAAALPSVAAAGL
ncbi:hypothetical protein PLESTB_001197400 [Pleodorina starrii]|uniref:CRC domain-containing protein n=1 Tax=Pleodorina starrii TaxID=330485 RepID=A0A9W6F644_9CHLO|nr:hypothetical protein PLESTB_001197400 [Pleodorina starrii]